MGIAKERLPLTDGWKYKAGEQSEAGDSSVWHNAQPLPTSIHLDLLANHTIPDPFVGKNEELVQWVGDKTWIYEKQFTIPERLRSNPGQQVDLVFEGLDTFTTVILDNVKILETENMFVSHRVNITDQIRSTKTPDKEMHTLQIIFHNAKQMATEEMERHAEHSWFSFHFGNKRLAARKAQYHFGWDWSPVLTDCGPWKPIFLEAYQARLTDLSIRTSLDSDQQGAGLEISVEVEGKAGYARIDIEQDGVKIESCIITLCGERTTTTRRIRNPKLWWPWTLGEQNLYTVKCTIFNRLEDATEELELDSMNKRFGIRKIELIHQPLRQGEGNSFFFRVNDVPIFVAGSNWVPLDSFVCRATTAKYRNWIQLAKDTNQVMIRIWGGGIYEHDDFFDICDELGLLVWHDFMFACGIYPAHSSFESSVMTEARQNIVRLRHHPSIALWCGNNEDYAIAHLAREHVGKAEYDPGEMNPDKIRQSGFPARLFYEVRFPEVCKELIPDTPYWPGSPFGGSFCNDMTDGDIHQWYVWHLDKRPYQDYPQLGGRMVTEFGLQSIPHWKTVKQYYPADYAFSPDASQNCTTEEYMTWHNKGHGGPENILKYGVDNIPFDEHSLRGYIYCSQLIQSEGISTAFRAWRRQWRGPGQEYCGGALLWQLNDCWPVSSWSIADSNLRPKLAYWTFKRENQPITAGLSRRVNGGLLELEAWACNMTMQPVSVGYQIHAWHVKTGKSLWTQTVSTRIQLEPNRSTELGSTQLRSDLDGERQFHWNEMTFAIYLFTVPEVSVGGAIGRKNDIARFVNFHEPLKEVPFAMDEGQMTAKLIEEKTGSYIELSASVPMKCVYLDYEDDAIEWDDNGVDLVPEETTRVRVSGLTAGREIKLRVYWLGATGWQSQMLDVY
ncbi:glycoside hydrolase superfamily [Penicillium daleae]|uniref:Beta-mannosidase B n=1 Tax=Penicillium daleae TaxID=63821 RepID=A0AAD6G2M6_9EURO|nr:glycoside hydrolase superfamily [Penicillium daleae]KAJ5449651.1 glycoside hydrolase superfamily [Penicillium daleae]